MLLLSFRLMNTLVISWIGLKRNLSMFDDKPLFNQQKYGNLTKNVKENVAFFSHMILKCNILASSIKYQVKWNR